MFILKCENFFQCTQAFCPVLKAFCLRFGLGELQFITELVMNQAVRRQSHTLNTRVRFQVSACGICGGQSGIGTVFLHKIRCFSF
jgi:hypothetical protein